jgi:hypothetical protein
MNRRRIRWIAVVSLAALLLAAVAAYFYSERVFPEPWQYLAQVQQFEGAGARQAAGFDSIQTLAATLAKLGRDDEVRQMALRRPSASSKVAAEELKLTVVPWKSAIKDIAAHHRIVMVMEAHTISKDREFVGATLPMFKEAGFTHYAVEAISRFDVSLAERGYPNKFTGLYTADPKFGNALRRALDLKFTVLGYDFRFTTHDEREEYAASRLAKLFESDPQAKLVVHAGHSHVLKYKTALGEDWLAALLWKKTGIEPFTIWQWCSGRHAGDYEKIVKVLKARGVSLDEPVLLMPPPAFDCGLWDSPYDLAAVDAIVLHPPDESAAPAKRTVLFPDGMQRVAGRWTAKVWPVVISAYKKGEPVSAIPLDQIMLRQGETDFVLWIPGAAEYEIRVFDSSRLLKARIDREADSISVAL